MRKAVIVSRQRITGRTNGSSTYLLDIANALRAAGFQVDLVHPSPTMMGRTPVVRLSPDLSVFAGQRARSVLKFGRLMLSLNPATYAAAARGAVAAVARRAGMVGEWTRDRPLPYSVSIPWNAKDRSFLRRQLRDADVVIADYIFQAEAFDEVHAAGTATAIIMHDLFHARDASLERGSAREAVAAIDERTEASMLARADAVIAIQDSEASWVRKHVAGVRVILAPVAAYPVAAAQPGSGDRLLFVGSNTAPNVVGLRWFLQESWPRIRARRPDATLDVAGSVGRAFPDTVPGVRFLGFVDDLAALYAPAAVVISPLVSGSGLKVKLIEALAAGKAIVATRITLQGVEAEVSVAVRSADDPVAFAEDVVELLDDAAARLALACRALDVAVRHFSAETCAADLKSWLESLDKQSAE